ncbi:hypothetical protein PCE1_000134 [Barthelona sp. PCE]
MDAKRLSSRQLELLSGLTQWLNSTKLFSVTASTFVDTFSKIDSWMKLLHFAFPTSIDFKFKCSSFSELTDILGTIPFAPKVNPIDLEEGEFNTILTLLHFFCSNLALDESDLSEYSEQDVDDVNIEDLIATNGEDMGFNHNSMRLDSLAQSKEGTERNLLLDVLEERIVLRERLTALSNQTKELEGYYEEQIGSITHERESLSLNMSRYEELQRVNEEREIELFEKSNELDRLMAENQLLVAQISTLKKDAEELRSEGFISFNNPVSPNENGKLLNLLKTPSPTLLFEKGFQYEYVPPTDTMAVQCVVDQVNRHQQCYSEDKETGVQYEYVPPTDTMAVQCVVDQVNRHQQCYSEDKETGVQYEYVPPTETMAVQCVVDQMNRHQQCYSEDKETGVQYEYVPPTETMAVQCVVDPLIEDKEVVHATASQIDPVMMSTETQTEVLHVEEPNQEVLEHDFRVVGIQHEISKSESTTQSHVEQVSEEVQFDLVVAEIESVETQTIQKTSAVNVQTSIDCASEGTQIAKILTSVDTQTVKAVSQISDATMQWNGLDEIEKPNADATVDSFLELFERKKSPKRAQSITLSTFKHSRRRFSMEARRQSQIIRDLQSSLQTGAPRALPVICEEPVESEEPQTVAVMEIPTAERSVPDNQMNDLSFCHIFLRIKLELASQGMHSSLTSTDAYHMAKEDDMLEDVAGLPAWIDSQLILNLRDSVKAEIPSNLKEEARPGVPIEEKQVSIQKQDESGICSIQ